MPAELSEDLQIETGQMEENNWLQRPAVTLGELNIADHADTGAAGPGC